MKFGLPISWSTGLELQVSFPYTQCNFLSCCSMPFTPETCSGVPLLMVDTAVMHVRVRSPSCSGWWGHCSNVARCPDICCFLKCLTACTTGYIGEWSILSNINMSDSLHAYKLCPESAPLCSGLSWLPDAGLGACCCKVWPKWGVPCEGAICGNLRLRTRREESPEKLPYYDWGKDEEAGCNYTD